MQVVAVLPPNGVVKQLNPVPLQIRVGYNAAAEGYFEKNITITYNSNQTKQIIIKGTVWKAPEGSAPANASIDFLKKQSF